MLHDSGAAVAVDGKLVAAVNEERLTRIKQDRGVPVKSVTEVMKIVNLTPGDINEIRIVGHPPFKKFVAFVKTTFRVYRLLGSDFFKILFSKDKFQSVISRRLGSNAKERINMFSAVITDSFNMLKLLISFRTRGFNGTIKYIPHHLCHLYGAYSASGIKEKCLVINFEGTSFAYTTNIFIGEAGRLRELASTPDPHAVGHFYAAITELLGFRPGFHEGKVSGLSSWGRMDETVIKNFDKLYRVMEKMIWVEGLELRISKEVFTYPFYYSTHGKSLPDSLKGYKREAIAWAAQKRLEEIASEIVKRAIKATGIPKIVLTGGVTANVRMNQVIHELPEVKEIFIYPAMGDFGNAHGAAIAPKNPGEKIKIQKLRDLYLGPEYTDREIEKVLRDFGLKYKLVKSGLEKMAAGKLSKGKIVCLFRGQMEFGPRALGNRSIIAAATSHAVNDRLNDALKRSEFMPFAPVILYEEKDKYLKNVSGGEYPAEFMTITFSAKELMYKKCPAVVHVDGTARPQLIKHGVNPFYYNILKEYSKLTGVSVLINTSFNMHDEPIVCAPRDAVSTFIASGLDYLVIGDYFVDRPLSDVNKN